MISVLVVNHEGREHLRGCLASLEKELPAPHEVIVVDNASRDGSVEMIRRDFPWVRLISLDRNLGFGAANNRAAHAARGEYLLLLNSDAWLVAGSHHKLAAALAADPGLGAVAPEVRYPDGGLQFSWVPETGVVGEALQMLRNRWEARPWAHRQLADVLRRLGPGWHSASCLMVRRVAWEEVRGFDEGFFLYFEDVDLCRRLQAKGWRLAAVPEALAFHVKGGSMRGDRQELEYRRGQLRFYGLHRPRWEQWLLRRRLRSKARRQREPLRSQLLELIASTVTGQRPSWRRRFGSMQRGVRARLRRHLPRLTRLLGNAYRGVMPHLHRRLEGRLRRAADCARVEELRAAIEEGARRGVLSAELAGRLRAYARRLDTEAGSDGGMG